MRNTGFNVSLIAISLPVDGEYTVEIADHLQLWPIDLLNSRYIISLARRPCSYTSNPTNQSAVVLTKGIIASSWLTIQYNRTFSLF